jgi:hypothetical protein
MAKGKRQAARLRKSSTGAAVDAYYAKAASDARTGGDLRVAADEELFVIDTAPTPKDKLHVRTARADRRAAARVRPPAPHVSNGGHLYTVGRWRVAQPVGRYGYACALYTRPSRPS